MDLISTLLSSLLTALVLVSVGFVMAYAKNRRFDLIDVVWGALFIAIAWVNVGLRAQGNILAIGMAGLVTVWGLRLSRHILARWLRSTDEDRRYIELRRHWPKHFLTLQMYLRIYVVQALLATIISLPVIIFISSRPQFDSFVLIGAAIWAVGLAVEAIADRQLRTFLADERNRGTLMTRGLWNYSRHPNYFGEMMLWWGIGIIGLGQPYGLTGLVGPLVISGLLLFISGVPLAEKAMASKPGWLAYKSRTSVVVPWPHK